MSMKGAEPLRQTMHALRAHRRGGPEVLVYEEAPVPLPALDDVVLRVDAASLTPTELGWPSTWVDRRGLDRCPVVPCHEVSGVVVDKGYGMV
jgi:NADPH:quinone reductase-like Zn-dependent oxidoreductase